MTLNQFKKLNEEKGFFFFSKETINFFHSKVMYWHPSTGYFITREKSGFDSMVPAFTIRQADFKTGDVETIGKFNEFSTVDEAKTALMRLIKGKVEILEKVY